MLSAIPKQRLKDVYVSPEGVVRYEFWGTSDEIIEFDIDLIGVVQPIGISVEALFLLNTTAMCLILEQTKEIKSLNERLAKLEAAKTTNVY
jgi:hypothetical protein